MARRARFLITEDRLAAAEADPFLSNLELVKTPGFFSVSAHPRGRSISIAAQMRLAVGFVKHACDVELIGPDRPLFILGAGAAGVAAAIAAAKRDVPVLLRETESRPFSRQANCSTRWLHPNQYDWPRPWFADPEFPRAGDDDEEDLSSLAWTAAFSDQIAGKWRAQYRAFQRRGKIVEWFNAPRLQHEGGHYEDLVDECERNVPPGSAPHFAAFLLCRGFAPEDLSIGTYSGFEFWKTDPYEKPRAGIRADGAVNVIIAGFGDGGMQDFIRVAFGSVRPVEIVEAIAQTLESDPATEVRWSEFKVDVLGSLENGQSPRGVFGERDLTERFVASLDSAAVKLLHERLRPMLAFDFTNDFVMLVCEREHYPASFPLNRLIVRLLERFGRDRLLPTAPRISRGAVTAVLGHKHGCANDPGACHGVSHHCRVAAKPHVFHSLIIRRGLSIDERPFEQSVA